MLHGFSLPSAAEGYSAEARLYVERVRAIAPLIAAAGEQIDRERRVPEPLLGAMIDAGLFRMLLPRTFGGAEVHPLTFMHALEAIAAVEASPAWNVGQNAVCAIVAAKLAPEAAQRIFGDRRAILAWGPVVSDARAVACEGGYRVTGNWSFASGGRHATWLGGLCTLYEPDGTPRRDPNGEPAKRTMLFPAEKATFSDVWNVIGLRGTASDAFSVKDVFVPQEHTVLRDTTDENRETGWLYAFNTLNLFSCGFGSIALGVARALLDAFMRLAAEKTPRGFQNPLRENAVIQSELAQAEARLRSARAFLMQSVSEICDEVQRTRQVTLEQRMAIRLASTHAIHEARHAGDFAYEAAGATAIFASNPFERRFRDLHTIAQQVQGRKSHYETVGKFLLGLEAGTSFL
jgi:alkylation response protein AidB-like acyl-CoA dehydrogenase